MKLRFGKYKGTEIYELPTNYIVYLIEHTQDIYLRSILIAELYDRLAIGHNDFRKTYYKMALKYHPDYGGSTEAMKAINDFFKELTHGK